jgi:hypothetical protein
MSRVQLCNTAAERIMELLGTWRSLYTLRYVPITWIQIVYSAGTIFLLSACQGESGLPPSHINPISQAELCVQYLSEAGKSWQGARHVKEILERLLRQLTTRIEARSLETRQFRADVSLEESMTNPQRSPLLGGSSSGIPMPFTFSQQWYPFPQALHHTTLFPLQQPSPGFGPGISNVHGNDNFVPASDGDDNFSDAEHFGFPGIPANYPQLLAYDSCHGNPSLTGVDGELYDLQQDSDLPRYSRTQGTNASDQFGTQEGYD